MKEKTADLTAIIDLMYQQSGMVLTINKSLLILAKLQPLLKKYNLNNVDELYNMSKLQNNLVIDEIIDASFFHIDLFKRLNC